jgi:hypothetical protein
MTAQHTTAPPTVDIYSPAELSYLLAGRPGSAAKRARDYLGLAELGEGDAGLLTGVQALAASARATVVDGEIELSDAAKMVGFVLATASRWVRISIDADDTFVAMAFVQGPTVKETLILRILPLGNVEVALAEIGVASSVRSMFTGYLGRHDTLLLSIRADETAGYREVAVDRIGTGAPITLIRAHRVLGLDDVAERTGSELSLDELLDHVGTVVGE